MTLLRFASQNHPQQLLRPDVDARALPAEDFAKLDARFDFTVDAAAAAHNAKLDRYWDVSKDGLSQSWVGERVYCNPPFSKLAPWVAKAWDSQEAILIVMLLPANRTEQLWWQKYIEPFRDRPGMPLRVEFQCGRQRFIKQGASHVGPNERPPFGICLAIWQPNGFVPDFGRLPLRWKD